MPFDVALQDLIAEVPEIFRGLFHRAAGIKELHGLIGHQVAVVDVLFHRPGDVEVLVWKVQDAIETALVLWTGAVDSTALIVGFPCEDRVHQGLT